MNINHIFWWVAGANAEHLKQCPSDQKRIGAIGMVIMTTAFVAFIAGTAAAIFFTMDNEHPKGKTGWALAFGLLWMLIIFMIDRSLVVTLKKNPTLKSQFKVVIGPFIFRMFLSGIIALMISIPLELFIFRDFIKTSTIEYNNIEKDQVRDDSPETVRIQKNESIINDANNRKIKYEDDAGALSSSNNELNQKIAELKAQRNSPTSQRYQNAYNKYIELRNQLKSIDKDSNPSLFSDIKEKLGRESSIMQEEKKSWNEKIDAKIRPLEDRLTRNKAKLTEIQEIIDNESEKIGEYESQNEKYQAVIDTRVNTQDSLQQNTGHFFRDYQILSNTITHKNANGTYKHPMELLFYWLIRIIFFLIELLPTLVKVITPVGVYDGLVYYEEQARIQYFSSTLFQDRTKQIQDDKQQHEIDLQQQRLNADKLLQKEVIELARQSQLKVVQACIEQWEQSKQAGLSAQQETLHENNLSSLQSEASLEKEMPS